MLLQEELRWLGAMLGTVRDQDVLLDRLYTEAHVLPPAERKIFERLLTTFETIAPKPAGNYSTPFAAIAIWIS